MVGEAVGEEEDETAWDERGGVFLRRKMNIRSFGGREARKAAADKRTTGLLDWSERMNAAMD
jgi:hypothetical protein